MPSKVFCSATHRERGEPSIRASEQSSPLIERRIQRQWCRLDRPSIFPIWPPVWLMREHRCSYSERYSCSRQDLSSRYVRVTPIPPEYAPASGRSQNRRSLISTGTRSRTSQPISIVLLEAVDAIGNDDARNGYSYIDSGSLRRGIGRD